MENLKKNQFVVKKWEKFGEFWSRHSKVSVIYTLIGPLCAKYITFDLKSTEELSFMTLKCHAKFEEKLTHGFKNDMRNLVNFHQGTQKSGNFHFHGLLLSKVYNARQALAWRAGHSPHPRCHSRKSRNLRLRRTMKSPPNSKAAWVNIARAKFSITCPELVLIELI